MVNSKNYPSYQQAIDVLTSQGKFYINLGLERMQKILELSGNPQDKLKYIHVAGTNGKGSVSAMLSSILSQTKKPPFTIQHSLFTHVGLFTSPHVFEYTERIKINDVEIEKDIFAQKTLEIIDLAENNGIHLTEFEILTAVAFDYFAENNVDIVVLETGLGGRLDATNIIKENICSIITHIDFDHTERLGDSIEKISFEKAGIIKEICPVVISEKNAGFDIVERVAKEKNAPLFLPKEVPSDIEFSLKGLWQKENLALVFAAVDILNAKGFEVSKSSIENGLKNVKHPCRFEYLETSDGRKFIIDGAHNPNGARALRESLDYYFPDVAFNFIFGCLKNKDYTLIMDSLFSPKDIIYFYEFDSPNSCDYKTLEDVCRFNSKPFADYNPDNSTITVICGSFYMIKELLQKMGIK